MNTITFSIQVSYTLSTPLPISAAAVSSSEVPLSSSAAIPPTTSATRATPPSSAIRSKCYNCGNSRHPRMNCPARDVICHKCSKTGHFAKVCKPSPSTSPISTTAAITLASITDVSAKPFRVSTDVLLNDTISANALIDSGSSEKSFISSKVAHMLKVEIYPEKAFVGMAASSMTVKVRGYCFVKMELNGRQYNKVRLSILDKLCTDVILGTDFQSLHEKVIIKFGGKEPSLTFCALTALAMEPPSLFANTTPNCKPIATKSRRRTPRDTKFIDSEVDALLRKGVIEPSNSPWRAQVLVVDERGKKRLVIDYSQTINRFTLLDAYPLPRIDDMVNELAQYKVLSTLDLRSAYHQVPLSEHDKPFTAFEARGKLYQFCRMPFGVSNGAACFQRTIDRIINENNLKGTYAYLDNVTIGGKDQQEHNENLAKFLEVSEKYKLTLNEDKSIYSVTTLDLLGYRISDGTLSPDPNRLQPLLNLPVPTDLKSLRRAVGLFAYYAKWIQNFSDKVRSLNNVKAFPISEEAKTSFINLKKDLADVTLASIDEDIPFVVETDASNFSIAATLNQGGRPVAFFSRTLQSGELNRSSVEKEAQSIVEAVDKWRHFLLGRHFTIITDQRSVSFMYNQQASGKVRNERILRWRTALASFCFNIVYRPGAQNNAADTFTRVYCSSISRDSLKDLHTSLCHPGVTRMMHFCRMKNLPYSLDEVKQITASCNTCSRLKPRFYRPSRGTLIKATQPFERLSLDFKGPLPSTSSNRYILTVVDEYSRFPFAFPCADVSTPTVIRCLTSLFSIFGMPAYIHSDRGSAFMSQELKQFLSNIGVASSRTTSYHPEGNGQVERYNGIIWRAVLLALDSRNMPTTCWESILSDALHSIRSLLCTSTNETPHERFFIHQRRSSKGDSIPSWLTNPGKVFMKRNVRQSKHEPLVDEVDLLEANTHYAHIRYPDGRETTVSTRQLAPNGDSSDKPIETDTTFNIEPGNTHTQPRVGHAIKLATK